MYILPLKAEYFYIKQGNLTTGKLSFYSHETTIGRMDVRTAYMTTKRILSKVDMRYWSFWKRKAKILF